MVEEEPTSADWQEAANQAAALASDADAQARMLWAIVADFRQKAREGENAKKLD
jgi:hypothetical protein